MLRQDSTSTKLAPEFTDDEIAEIVSEQLPQWKAACDNPSGDVVLIQQEAFQRSVDDMFLLHAAIRYAGSTGKTVMIVPYTV